MQNQNLAPDFFIQALAKNSASLTIRAETIIRDAFDGQAVVPCQQLDVQQFSRLNLCELVASQIPRPSFTRYWGGEDYDSLFTNYEQVIWEARWNEHHLHIVHLQWDTSCGGDIRDWVVAQTKEIAEAFILDVERKTHAPGNAILVFSNGRWHRSEPLYEATQAASFEDLVLADDLKQTIRDDFAHFLKAEHRYSKLGISWRRGALLIGPPGNGKTHCVRALVKELAISSLYVQSLSHHYYTPEQLWQQIFDRARGLRPCVLVLEDLDSLIDDENRSFFLNQLDGFEQNHGLIVLATTNYPERIDAAIIDRPSRFDRKYHFELPAHAERVDYLRTWQEQLASETSWLETEISGIADETAGFSFAYLKELVISTVMKWMQSPEVPFARVMSGQASLLAKQMKTESAPPAPGPPRSPGTNGRPRGRRQRS